MNTHNDLFIADIERNEGFEGEIDFSSEYSLPVWYRGVRNKRISELSDDDVSIFIRQDLYLEYIVPESLKRLREDPIIGEQYNGEMMTALYKLNGNFWMNRGALLKEVQNLLDEINRDKTVKKYEWLYDGEEYKFYNMIKLFNEKLSRLKLT